MSLGGGAAEEEGKPAQGLEEAVFLPEGVVSSVTAARSREFLLDSATRRFLGAPHKLFRWRGGP